MDNFEYPGGEFGRFNQEFGSPEEMLNNGHGELRSDNGEATGNSKSPGHGELAEAADGGKPKSKRTRATGEALELLKKEFDINPNPNAQNRKRISEQTGLPEKNVRIWFQNRRAKYRKSDRTFNQRTAATDMNTFGSISVTVEYDKIPLNINDNYYFIDANSLTVGSWKRLKSGNLHRESLSNIKYLSNLSPTSINMIMSNATDLMVLISKKNFEVNYFFSAIANNTKILFRIFFPINSVLNCSLLLHAEGGKKDEDDANNVVQETTAPAAEQVCELKLNVSKPPNFAVYFSDMNDELTSNQWSICEDFSEGRQVSDAYVGGSNFPHVLTGLEASLKFMSSLILDYNSTTHVVPHAQPQPHPHSHPHHSSDPAQAIVLQPEPHSLAQSAFFRNYGPHSTDDILDIQDPDQYETAQTTNTEFPSTSTAAGSHFLTAHLADTQIPKTPEFLNQHTDLHNDDQHGLNNLLNFNDQPHTSNAEQYY
ncbi:AFL202Cp [Eremothecium gossypii ATCC 10895]|uniref:AFL202Cp n=1 Tax=Eremothecium gossypii (strain ATCC 10895 / CBS 109.51 / FGSC 9923 / NRRL Y-1056) TaxID=284811 RepID=Q755L6_EREGS|nr:AFL202Cp [Eremothecium gossypii ATCC 10895]AAS53172.2 AFL202Cp [Eremothecium gossypii ATCC 10895]AEY97482.1 FAFL202Cp [Eremothecium gossypii FDAG1]